MDLHRGACARLRHEREGEESIQANLCDPRGEDPCDRSEGFVTDLFRGRARRVHRADFPRLRRYRFGLHRREEDARPPEIRIPKEHDSIRRCGERKEHLAKRIREEERNIRKDRGICRPTEHRDRHLLLIVARSVHSGFREHPVGEHQEAPCLRGGEDCRAQRPCEPGRRKTQTEQSSFRRGARPEEQQCSTSIRQVVRS